MAIVLVERILKLVFLAIDALRPLRTLLISKNPAIHVLCFNDKHTVARNDDMINLCRSVSYRDSDVIHVYICMGVEKHLLGEGSLYLPYPTLENCPERHRDWHP